MIWQFCPVLATTVSVSISNAVKDFGSPILKHRRMLSQYMLDRRTIRLLLSSKKCFAPAAMKNINYRHHSTEKTMLLNVLAGLLIVTSVQCATTSEREKSILAFSKSEAARYHEFLIDPKEYTTNGAIYHDRYYNHLVGVARALATDYKFSIAKNSIGFYFDKKLNLRDRLYLGIDIEIPLDESTHAGSSYQHIAVTALETYLKDVLAVINSCTTIFGESEIIGMVVGFHWKIKEQRASINIWIDERDVVRYENKQLTMKELISRSYITNTEGKLIRLLL